MRVLHIVSGKLYGGVETHLVALARHRSSVAELEQHFAVCFEGRLSRELRGMGAQVHRLGAVRVRNPPSILAARARLRALIADERVDAVICHMAWAHAIFAPVARAGGCAVVFWLHMATAGRHWLERWAAMTPPDLALAPSEFTAATLPNLFPGIPAKVIHYAVSPPDPTLYSVRDTVCKELDTPSDAVVTIQASRMEPWKGHRVQLEALARLREMPDWVCWIVGGAQRPREVRYLELLREEARRIGVAPRVRFTGQRTDVARLLAAADIYCQPNTGLEGLPVVFAEALYAGRPIVTSDIGGFSELVDDSCGIRVPPGDSAAVAAALRRLIADPATRRRLGDAGAARAREFCDPPRQLRRLFDALDAIEGVRDGREAAAIPSH